MAHVNLLLNDSLLRRVDQARAKQPRVSWIRDAIEEKLDRGILSGEMLEAKPNAPVQPTAPVRVPRETPDIAGKDVGRWVADTSPKREYQRDPADCSHPWRTKDRLCLACGDQR